MYNYKRACRLICLVLFSGYLFLSINLFADDGGGEKHKLDSVYNAFLNSKGLRTKNAYPGITGNINPKPEKCSFGLISFITVNYSKYSLTQQKIISKLLQRPDLQQSIVSKSGHFRIHFDLTGDNTPGYDSTLSVMDNIMQVAAAFDSAASYENGYLGYPYPPSDNGNGGDNLYDIYIVSDGDSYGATEPDDVSSGNATSYIHIDNNYSKAKNFATTGLNGMRVTAAHEYHHAIQVGNYGGFPAGEDRFFYELTSTSMEEFVFNTINDYYNYLDSYFGFPDRSLPQYSGYELCIWNIYLVKKYGFKGQQIIKRQWELKLTMPVLDAINTSLLEHNSSFKSALNEFGVWTYFTGYRKRYDTKNKYFEEGANYPEINLSYPSNFTPPGGTTSFTMKPLSNKMLKYVNNSEIGFQDSIVVLTTNGDFHSAETNPYQDISAEVALSSSEISGGEKLSDDYYWKINSGQNEFFASAAILNNIPVIGVIPPTTADVSEDAYPVPFSYQNNSFILIPAFYNDTRYAELKVFSPSMNLVFSRNENIFKDNHNQFVVEWNGRDSKNNKLPTGVYIFVTSSDDKIKKGKLVIKNE